MANPTGKGGFVKGQSGNPAGRAKRSTEERYLNALTSRVTLKDWREIVDAAVVKAKRGDPRARQWLSDYLLGPPVQRLEHSGNDGGPIIVKGYVTVSPDDWDDTNSDV